MSGVVMRSTKEEEDRKPRNAEKRQVFAGIWSSSPHVRSMPEKCFSFINLKLIVIISVRLQVLGFGFHGQGVVFRGILLLDRCLCF